MDCVSPREPAAWIAALRLDDLEQYVLVTWVRPNPRRGIIPGAMDQQLLGLLRLMLRRATCAKSPGTRRSAAAAAGKVAAGVGAGQSIAATRLG